MIVILISPLFLYIIPTKYQNEIILFQLNPRIFVTSEFLRSYLYSQEELIQELKDKKDIEIASLNSEKALMNFIHYLDKNPQKRKSIIQKIYSDSYDRNDIIMSFISLDGKYKLSPDEVHKDYAYYSLDIWVSHPSESEPDIWFPFHFKLLKASDNKWHVIKVWGS